MNVLFLDPLGRVLTYYQILFVTAKNSNRYYDAKIAIVSTIFIGRGVSLFE